MDRVQLWVPLQLNYIVLSYMHTSICLLVLYINKINSISCFCLVMYIKWKFKVVPNSGIGLVAIESKTYSCLPVCVLLIILGSSSIKVKDESSGAVYSVGHHNVSAASQMISGRIITFLVLAFAVFHRFW